MPSVDPKTEKFTTPSNPLDNVLYVVATPIGNLEDITLRALRVLANVDQIACEDTRMTGRLLKHFGITTRMMSYHDHNAAQKFPEILKILENGQSVALVSDAGTPLISDPGYRLVKDIGKAGFRVVPVPGASSPITALSGSGLATDSFFFDGFLPAKEKARQTRLENLATIPATLVFLESAKRLPATLQTCLKVLGPDRNAVVARELTKIYETFHRGPLAELAKHFESAGAPKGEIVLMIGPPATESFDEEAMDKVLINLLRDHRLKEAAEIASEQSGLSKRDLYQRALKLKAGSDPK